MNQYYPNIFKPLKVGNTIFKNRIFGAPSSMKDLGPNNILTDNNIAYYRMIAKGGAAVVTLGDAVVDPTGCVDYSYKVKMFDGKQDCRLYDLATAIKQMGSVPSIELDHAGAHFTDKNRINYGVSHIDVDHYGNEVIEMDKDMIEKVVEAFGQAALKAKNCGYEMCLIHAGHGWLVHEFLSPLWNKRTDEFGGSLENRCRFATMIVDRIRKYCGKGFLIEVRISYIEDVPGGSTLEDAIGLAKALDGKADMIHITHGSLNDPDSENCTTPPWFLERNLNVEMAAEIKKHVKMPVGVVGAIARPDEIEEMLASGKVDYVVVCRGLIADPELPNKAMKGRSEDIRPCLRCNACISCGYANTTLKCSVNPVIGIEGYSQIDFPVKEKKKVLIAGAGPAGIQAALKAKERGHHVILCEKTNHPLGMLNYAVCEDFKDDLKYYMKYLVTQLEKSGVEIRYNTVVDADYIAKEQPDKVIIAIGAMPANPPIKGLENSLSIFDLYDGKSVVSGENVVVLGGGMTGCEAAIGYAMKGKHVTIIEMQDEVVKEAGYMQKSAVVMQLKQHKVNVLTKTKCLEVGPNYVLCQDAEGRLLRLAADCVIAATGLVPKTDEAYALMEASTDGICIGDCHKTGFVLQANRGGYDAAMNL